MSHEKAFSFNLVGNAYGCNVLPLHLRLPVIFRFISAFININNQFARNNFGKTVLAVDKRKTIVEYWMMNCKTYETRAYTYMYI